MILPDVTQTTNKSVAVSCAYERTAEIVQNTRIYALSLVTLTGKGNMFTTRMNTLTDFLDEDPAYLNASLAAQKDFLVSYLKAFATQYWLEHSLNVVGFMVEGYGGEPKRFACTLDNRVYVSHHLGHSPEEEDIADVSFNMAKNHLGLT